MLPSERSPASVLHSTCTLFSSCFFLLLWHLEVLALNLTLVHYTALGLTLGLLGFAAQLEPSPFVTWSGGYADSCSGAMSTMGPGEKILKVNLAWLAIFHLNKVRRTRPKPVRSQDGQVGRWEEPVSLLESLLRVFPLPGPTSGQVPP